MTLLGLGVDSVHGCSPLSKDGRRLLLRVAFGGSWVVVVDHGIVGFYFAGFRTVLPTLIFSLSHRDVIVSDCSVEIWWLVFHVQMREGYSILIVEVFTDFQFFIRVRRVAKLVPHFYIFCDYKLKI